MVIVPHSVGGQINSNTQITSSFLITNISGEIYHLQVDNSNSRIVWRNNYLQGVYKYIDIIDLDRDGTYEIVGVDDNVLVNIMDFLTGELLFSYELDSNSASLKDVAFGDLNNDGYDEIVLTHHVPLTGLKSSIYIIDYYNKDVKIIDQFVRPGNQLGADNVAITDLNGDGNNQLLLSYGSSLYDINTGMGKYFLEIWDFNSNTQSYQLQTYFNGSDIGGNTRLKILQYKGKSCIFTSGWYNNPIRRFSTTGRKVWERQLDESNTLLRLADKPLMDYTDGYGRIHLFSHQNNYWWGNYSLSLYDLNFDTGDNQIEPLKIGNISNVYSMIYDNYLYLSFDDNSLDSLGRVLKRINLVSTIENKEFAEFEELNTDNGQLWERILINRFQPRALIVGDKSYIVVNDEYSTYYLANPKSNIKLSDNRFGTYAQSVVLNQHRFVQDGEILENYDNDGPNPLTMVILILAALSLANLVYNRIQETRFHRSFGRNWGFLFYAKISRIIQRKIEQMPTQIPLISQIDLEDDYEGTMAIDEPLPNLEAIFEQEQINNNASKLLTTFLAHHSNLWNKVKTGDIAILIELLDSYSKGRGLSGIQERFEYVNKKTIYNRVDNLEDLGLVEKVIPGQILDARRKSVMLTPHGLKFLEVLYNSLTILYLHR